MEFVEVMMRWEEEGRQGFFVFKSCIFCFSPILGLFGLELDWGLELDIPIFLGQGVRHFVSVTDVKD